MDGVSTAEVVERLLQEAGFSADMLQPGIWDDDAAADGVTFAALHRFAALVAEECARMADEAEEGPSAGPAIRAKFKTEP